MNVIAKSWKLTSGCSYITHIILAASIADPPPSEITTSGWKLVISAAPALAHLNVGSGSTSENILYWIPCASKTSVTLLVYPISNNTLSVTMNAFFLPISPNSAKATGKHPYLK